MLKKKINSVLKKSSINLNSFKIGNHSSKIFITLTFLVLAFTANATVYYVSNTGSDSNTGTSADNPWKTLSKVSNFSFSPGDQILFKRGDQWSGTVTVSAAGTSGSPVVYGAYGSGMNPKIYGSELITGWTKHSGNIYKASFSSTINQLFLSDERMKAARHPNSGYIFITSTSGTTSLTADALDGSKNYAGAKWFGRTNYYTTSLLNVSSSSSKTLTLNAAPRYPLKAGLGFFLMNKLEFLDAPGEWYYDAASKTVYLWTATGDSPANYQIRGSVHKDGFYLSGKDYVTISDIHFLHQSEKGIHLNNSDFVVINKNEFSYADGFGIYSRSDATNIKISNNTITGVNHYGMYIRISNSVVADNTLSKIALFDNIGLTGTGEDNFGGGIYLAGEQGNNQVRYNRLTEIGYTGILFGRPKNLIEYNFIKDVCLLKSDMGGIYTSWYNRVVPIGPDGSIIKNNIVLNVKGEKYGYTSTRHLGEGIYIDESAKGVTVENNTIAHVTNSGIKLHKNENSTVRNNTILDARQSIHVLNYSGTLKNHINNNIMMAASAKDDYLQRQVLINETVRNAVCDYNEYVNPYASAGIFRSGSTYLSFNEWKSATGQEQNSTVNITPMATGEKEVLFYNDTKSDKTFNLGTNSYKDLKGIKVTGSFILKPFTSRILIGGSSNVVVENQRPVIADQNFEISSEKVVNDFIGQVIASDPDAGQVLTWSIVSGNSEGLFAIGSTTGKLTASKPIGVTSNKTVVLGVQVKDNAGSPLTASANVTINIKAVEQDQPVSDLTAPAITAFSIPSTSGVLTVPVNIQATDNKGVTGWKLSETSSVPTPSDADWLSTVPAHYTFSGAGTKTLFAWAKDAAGNISSSAKGTVVISLTNDNTATPDNSTEVVSICEGENYLGWTESGIYERTVDVNKSVENAKVNLISNGDFSNGTNGWSAWGASGYNMTLIANNKDYISSPGSMEINCSLNGTSLSSLQFISLTNMSVTAGKEYELSFYAKATTAVQLRRFVVIQRVTPFEHYGTFENVIPVITQDWKQIKVKFIASRTATDASLRIYLGNELPAGHSIFFDDLVFSENTIETVAAQQVIKTYLTVNKPVYTTEDITINEGEAYMGWTTAGEYTRTMESSAGCDSIITTNLSVGATLEFVTICEGEEYNGWVESGIYEWKSPAGTLMKTHLTVEETKYVTETIRIWSNQQYNGWNESGHYERVLKAASGCDSVVITKLIVRGKSQNDSNYTVELKMSTKSINADNNEISLEGESVNDFRLYPNPAETYINVEYPYFPKTYTRIEIVDGSGRTVHSQEAVSAKNRIDFNQLNPGMYFLRSINDQSQQVQKFIIK